MGEATVYDIQVPGVINWEARVHAYAGRKEWALVPNMGGGRLHYFLTSFIIA